MIVDLTMEEIEAIHTFIGTAWAFSPIEDTEPEGKMLRLRQSIENKLKETQMSADLVITNRDFFGIRSLAVGTYKTLGSNLYISNKKVESRDLANISLAESLLVWLNSKGVLKKLVRFDFTDCSADFEPMND